MQKGNIWMAAAVIAAMSGVGGPSTAEPLANELARLTLSHPQIKSASKGIQSAHAEVEKRRAGYLPTVSAVADIGHENVDSPGERSSGNRDGFGRQRQTASLTATQNLFDGFATSSQVRSAKIAKHAAKLGYHTTMQATLFEGISAYIDVLQQRRLIELARNNERTIQRQLNLEDERVQRGSGVAVDVLQAKSRLQLAKERRVTFEGALEQAVTRYKQVYNHAPNLDTMMDPLPPVELIPTELEAATEIAVSENPNLANTFSQVEVARERKRELKSQYYPSIDLETKVNYEKHKNATLGTRRDYSVLLKANWDLFTGLSTQASQEQANFDFGAARDQFDFVQRKVIESVRTAWQDLLTARDRLELLENAVNIASEVFVSRKKLREAGKETVINVLDAENEVINAQINYTAASYSELTAVYQLLLAMGRLTPAQMNLPL